MFTLKFSINNSILDRILSNGAYITVATREGPFVLVDDAIQWVESDSTMVMSAINYSGHIEIRRTKRHTKVKLFTDTIVQAEGILRAHGYTFTNFPSEFFGIRVIGQQDYWPVARPVKDLNYGLMCNGAEESFLVTDALIQNVKEMMRSIVVHGSRRVLEIPRRVNTIDTGMGLCIPFVRGIRAVFADPVPVLQCLRDYIVALEIREFLLTVMDSTVIPKTDVPPSQ